MDIPDTIIGCLTAKRDALQEDWQNWVRLAVSGAADAAEVRVAWILLLSAQEALLREQERTRHMGRGNGCSQSSPAS